MTGANKVTGANAGGRRQLPMRTPWPPASLSSCVLRKTMPPELEWGLLACGRSGQTEIDVDQTCAGEELFEMEISKPGWSLRFRISHPEVIGALASFLAAKSGSSMIIGALEGIPV